MFVPHHPDQNHLLSSLPADEFNRIAPHLELAPMPQGEVYYGSGGKLQYVYFPTTSIVSLHHATENGAQAEIAGVGYEGMLGISLFIGGKAPPTRAFVRTAGYGYKLKARLLMDEFSRGGSLQRSLLRYTQALITQTSQTAICNHQHTLEQRLCRWLLLTLDRLPSNDLIVTQDLLAGMLGVGRSSVMDVVGALQQAGLIRYRRGRITVLDRDGIKQRACECYSVVKTELDRLLGLDWDWRPMPDSVKTWSRASTKICAQV